MKKLFPGILVLWLVCGSGSALMAQDPQTMGPRARLGVLDLRGQDLSSGQVTLGGQWRFFWKQLISPSAPLPPDGHPDYVTFPSLWREDSLRGRPLPSQGYASYALTVLLPPDHPQLALSMPDVYCSYNFYVNGLEIAHNGKPGTTRESAIPFWSTRIAHLPQGTDTLHLVLQMANFWHDKGGTYRDILLGRQETMLLAHQQRMAYALILTGCLYMGGLFFLGLYLFGRHDRTILYFSLFCIVYSYRLIGTEIYAFHSLFPALSWFVTIRLEYLSLAAGIALFGQYTRCLYPEDTHPWLMNFLLGCCGLFSVIILFSDPLFFTHLLTPFLVILFLYTAYASYVYVQAARHKRSGSVYTLVSTSVIMLIFLLSNLHYFHLAPSLGAIVFACYIAFFFLQSLALSHRFADTFRQAAAEAQEGMKIKSEFLSTMSHEIRTPLNSVIGLTHLLMTSHPREDQKRNLNVLYFSANNLLSIVNNIFDYNKIEAGKIIFEHIPFDLAPLCRNIVAGLQTAAEEKGIRLELEILGKLDRKLLGDPTRLSQVITNLVHNAVKFTREGSVRLSVEIDAKAPDSAQIAFRVQDTGIGISPEKQQMIFERFTQADSSNSRIFGGTGLGLAITKRILMLQGVQLHLNSQLAVGSVFYFTQQFPLTSEVTDHHREEPLEPSLNDYFLEGLHILLVEDNPMNVLVAQSILEKKKAIIEVAVNGQEALDKFDPSRHQLILMDLSMPVMDGYEATRQLRKRGETLPIIALTASTPKEVESDAYAAGITDIVVKPFTPDYLYRIILQYAQPLATCLVETQ